MATYRRGGRAKTIAATEAAKNFGELVNRVRETQEVYIVERGGRPVVQVGPVDSRRCTVTDFVHTLTSLGATTTPGFADAVERGVRKANRPAVPKNRWPRSSTRACSSLPSAARSTSTGCCDHVRTRR